MLYSVENIDRTRLWGRILFEYIQILFFCVVFLRQKLMPHSADSLFNSMSSVFVDTITRPTFNYVVRRIDPISVVPLNLALLHTCNSR
jgi:hypothetical protein